MNHRIAKKIAKRYRLFLNVYSSGWRLSSVHDSRLDKATRVLRRRYSAPLRAGTHVVQDGRLVCVAPRVR